jgi:uncharacterized RDD family membrane protein YckC
MPKPNRRRSRPILIEYEVAGVGRRISAFLFDFLLLQLPYLALIAWLLLEAYINSLLIALVLALPAVLYHLLWEVLAGGQTPGKRLVKLKVVKLDGTEPYFEQYLVRWACRLVDIVPYGAVAVLMILFAGKGQRLGDKLANTIVVKYDPTVLEQLLADEDVQNHQLVYPEANQLSPHQVALIRKILAQYRKTGQAGPVQSLAEMIQQELNLNQVEDSPVAFLTQLGQDFDYLKAKSN